MGARTSNRKRGDECLSFNHTYPSQNSSDFHVSKRPRFSSMHQNPDRTVVSSNSTVARLSRYPEATPRLGREVHAPCRILNYGFSSTSLNQKSGPRTSGVCEKEKPIDEMGNILSYKYNIAKNSALRAIRHLTKGKEKEKEVIDVDTDNEKGSRGGGVSEDSSIEEVDVVNGVVVNVQELDAKTMDRGLFPSSSSAVSDLTNGNLRVENEEKMLNSLSLNHERDLSSVSAYKKLLESVEKRTSKLRNLSFEIEVNEKRRSIFQLLRPATKPVEVKFFYLLYVKKCFFG
jgi:sentrin-specific protease 1